MAAANTDKLRKTKSNFATTLDGSITDSDTTIALSSTTGLPTDTAVTLTIDRVDANGTALSTTERVIGVISGNNLTNAVRANDGTTAQAHSSGAVVECIWDADSVNDIIDAFLVDHAQDGTHNTLDLNGTEMILDADGDTTITADTDDQIDVKIANADDFKFTANTFTALSGSSIATDTISETTATSGVTIDGCLIKDGIAWGEKSIIIQVEDGGTNLSTGDGKAYITIPSQLNGTNLTSVHARVITAPTNAAISIMVHNLTDTSDMLSTALTIDATETGSDTAATPAVIDTAEDDVVTNDCIRIDIDQVGSTLPGAGLIIRLGFDLP